MTARKALCVVIAVIVFSPLIYYSTGIGQQAHTLSAELIWAAGGLQNSPKAEALHRLTLPIGVERLLVYPLFLLLLQYSGLAVSFRNRLNARVIAPYEKRAGFARLNDWLTRRTKGRLTLSDVIEIGLYITLVTFFITLVYFPFSAYQGFILRRQFGLSTQTLSAWLRDFWVGEGVNLVLTLVTYGGLYLFMKLMPQRWPVWLGGVFAILLLGYVLLEPIVITPLFYKITPVTDAELKSRILTMTRRAGLRVDDISIIDASSKTTTVNAYVTGFGSARKIVLWDNLLTEHPPDEQDVVIAHELGHWFYHHVLILISISAAGTWLGLFILRYWFRRVWQKLGWRGPDDVASYPYLLALIALVSLLTLPVANGISRLAENQADQFALDISQKPAAAISLFERLAEQNLSRVRVPAWEKVLFFTHPPLIERIERAQQAASSSHIIDKDNK
jgi:STE24 endopeptidase